LDCSKRFHYLLWTNAGRVQNVYFPPETVKILVKRTPDNSGFRRHLAVFPDFRIRLGNVREKNFQRFKKEKNA
jgi:hypothetical protein